MPPPRAILLGKNREPPERTIPPLPLSPISNSSPPSHKRSRTASWQPPPHIPDFLPPFPTTIGSPPSPLIVSSPQPGQFEPPSVQAMDAKVEKPPLSLAQAITSSSSASDYLVQVPYSQSSLSGVAEWHLPSAQPASKSVPARQPRLPTPQTEQALFTAYHHILTHPPPSNGNSQTPSRHRIAIALLSQIQTTPRWEPPDTLYSGVAPCPPRVATIGPTYPMATGDIGSDSKARTEKDVKFPPAIPRPVSSNERLTPLISQQASRIPDLARRVLPVSRKV
jgi:Wiskott-Aldrich syndrome protein